MSCEPELAGLDQASVLHNADRHNMVSVGTIIVFYLHKRQIGSGWIAPPPSVWQYYVWFVS